MDKSLYEPLKMAGTPNATQTRAQDVTLAHIRLLIEELEKGEIDEGRLRVLMAIGGHIHDFCEVAIFKLINNGEKAKLSGKLRRKQTRSEKLVRKINQQKGKIRVPGKTNYIPVEEIAKTNPTHSIYGKPIPPEPNTSDRTLDSIRKLFTPIEENPNESE